MSDSRNRYRAFALKITWFGGVDKEDERVKENSNILKFEDNLNGWLCCC